MVGNMSCRVFGIVTSVLLSTLFCPAHPDPVTYQQEFMAKVVRFANLNRLKIASLHRDVHANCYIPVTVATVIRSNGSVKDAFVVKSSTVPVVDRYFLYVIQQAAPYQPLADEYDPVPAEITITQEFRLDVQLWGHGIRSTRACDKLGPREPRTGQVEGTD
jgi:TonB family protein